MKNKIAILLIIFAGTFVMSSCLKDDGHDYWKDGVAGKSFATIPLATLQQLALQPVPGEVNFTFDVNIATDALPSQDITLTLEIDPAAVASYNASAGRSFKVFPNVQLLTPTVTVAKGTRMATVEAKVWGAETLDACDNYMTAITITTVSGGVQISGNMKSYLLALPISNPYAGDYLCNGYRIRPGNPTEPVVNAVEPFHTVDCKTVQKNGFGNYSPFDIVIEVTSTVMVVGGVNCYKVIATPIDPGTGGSVGGMWDTWHGDAATAPAPPANPTDINYYNPVTKTFYLNCYYTSSAGNRIMWEKLVRM